MDQALRLLPPVSAAVFALNMFRNFFGQCTKVVLRRRPVRAEPAGWRGARQFRINRERKQ